MRKGWERGGKWNGWESGGKVKTEEENGSNSILIKHGGKQK